ncbi:GAF domain-containing protein [Streptomyces sp. NPDC005438]|uniref:GAF domain-containing protein n=1 Tax=Streptomyces sp. NPDC005438 TaxID=3156880 RepID=UPI0033B5CB16
MAATPRATSEAPSELSRRRHQLEHEWSRLVPVLSAAQPVPRRGDALRPEVTDSWARSLPTVDPGRDSAPVSGEVSPRWARSPLREPVDALSDELHSIADDAGYVAAVTDESGTILWTRGGRVMRRRAERVNFCPGGRWDEPAMGTNALSLALRTGRPHFVFSAEHLVAALHGWVCYCAPIHAPDGRVLGVLDLSTTWDRSHPLAMSTVRSLVTTIEAGLRATPSGPDRLSSPAPPRSLRLLALGEGELLCDGVLTRLRPRQLEILTLLALEPEGLGAERLREEVYGHRRVSASTFKAEVSHLRQALGGGVTHRTYRLTVPVTCDAVEVLRALERGDLDAALRHYRGPLLPRSEAPGVLRWREQLEVAVRDAVLSSGDPEHALRYGARAPWDLEVHQYALRSLGPADPRRALVRGRLSAAARD